MKIKYSKELLEPIIKNSNNYKEVTIMLGLSYCNGSLKRLKKEITIYNLDISHFVLNKTRQILNNEDLFIENSKTDRKIVKTRILKDKLIPYICECCGQDENWQNKIMPLILDHKNGVNNDNRLENLRFLCSNCDSIQDTYKSKNKNLSKTKQINRNNLLKEALKLKKIENSINKIKNSNIDFTKHGYLIEVGKLMNWTPQWSQKFIKKYIPSLDKTCKKHK